MGVRVRPAGWRGEGGAGGGAALEGGAGVPYASARSLMTAG